MTALSDTIVVDGQEMAVADFEKADGLRVGGDLNLIGTAVRDLPEGLSVGGTLDLSGPVIRDLPRDLLLDGAAIERLPKNLSIGGSLKLRDTAVETLPANLSVGGDLDLRHTAVRDLPEKLSIGGSLSLRGAAVRALPDDLSVGGDLTVSDTAIRDLPRGLSVGGTLDLSGTAVETLPDDLSLGGSLDLSGTAVRDLPENLRVVGNLNLRNTSIRTLPGGLSVGGTLDLSGTAIRDLPGDLSVRGGLLLNSEYGWELAAAWPKLEASRAEGGSAVALEMAAALKICLGYLDEELGMITGRERFGGNVDSLEAILKPVRAALDGATVETPPEDGSAVVPEMAAALTICRDYLNERSRLVWDRERTDETMGWFYRDRGMRIGEALIPVCNALNRYMADPGPERETGPAATGKKARGRSMDGGMTP